MPLIQATYHSKLFRDFAAIPRGEYRELIRFYERHEAGIRNLDFEEYFALLMSYTDALFETAEYDKHLLMADVVIETSVMSNVRMYQGEDIFERHLFRKAASFYYLLQYKEAIFIITQLVRINPKKPIYARFWSRIALRMMPNWLHQARAVGIFLLLLSALLTAIEVIFVRPLYGMYAESVVWSRTWLFLGGVLSLVTGESLHRWFVYRQEKAMVKEALDYKASKEARDSNGF